MADHVAMLIMEKRTVSRKNDENLKRPPHTGTDSAQEYHTADDIPRTAKTFFINPDHSGSFVGVKEDAETLQQLSGSGVYIQLFFTAIF